LDLSEIASLAGAGEDRRTLGQICSLLGGDAVGCASDACAVVRGGIVSDCAIAASGEPATCRMQESQIAENEVRGSSVVEADQE